jgi:hypothetical protein
MPAVPRPTYCIAGVPISFERAKADICDHVVRIKRSFQDGPIAANDRAFLHYLIVGGQLRWTGCGRPITKLFTEDHDNAVFVTFR